MKKTISESLLALTFISLAAGGLYYFEMQKGIPRLIWGGPLAFVFFASLVFNKKLSTAKAWIKRSYYIFLSGFFCAVVIQYLYFYDVIYNYGHWLPVAMLLPFIGYSLYGSIRYGKNENA